MIITKCADKKEWNRYFLAQKQAEFLQSWEWGEFQEGVKVKVIRIQAKEGDEIIVQAQGFEYNLLPLIKFVYFPKAPFIVDFLPYLQKQGYIFVRTEPLDRVQVDNYHTIAVNNRQPQHTFILDISATEDELLLNMHAKTRYNIKLAEKKGVQIRQEKNVDVFWKLNQETLERDRFKSHNREYYKKMLTMENCFQMTAYFENEAIASSILIVFGDTVTYLHGASSNNFRNLMAPYLLQWESIRAAKDLGAQYYDFGGVSPQVNSGQTGQITCYHNYCWEAAHKWTGITRFKVGFNGFGKVYPSAFEAVFKPLIYKMYRAVKK